MIPARRVIALLAALVVLLACAPSLAEESFPLRPYYPEVRYMSTEQLLRDYTRTVVVDIRSSFEYDVARINKAKLLPLTTPDFGEKLEKLRPKDDPTPMVFYCNGHSCAKSYQAAQVALSLGFSHVFAYDGGIFDWIGAAPDKATLMNETPARKDRIISPAQYETRLLGFDEFSRQAMEKDTVTIDIRDPFQRSMRPRIPGVRNIPLDPLLDLVVSRIWTEKRLLFFDAVGKQVRWLQYFLESYGYFDYAFLRGGMRAIEHDRGKAEPVIEANRSIVSNQEMLLTLTADGRLDNSDRKVMSFLLANVKFDNYIVVGLGDAVKTLSMGRDLLMSTMRKLDQLQYATHSVMQDSLIVKVDPRLAWKGKPGTKAWKDKLAEFRASVRD
ncbi:sulfurtransferase [Pseudodesulfovibrio cashew]|uniref:Sulfurtransferase n=1 Tax=Pseudodesulfovibrio cashew TaxID=2678688 RepID=A0A6I6JM65_9BACT|nr:rhodanese-like domain-containing protein [Pseudodesulfovibrio cashew]QGY38784.1 sulfurtransferase [Pseudodesulfovibrio cashew]